jgi:uncharacterized SAM-binding protein YcdF (DUF218 family)
MSLNVLLGGLLLPPLNIVLLLSLGSWLAWRGRLRGGLALVAVGTLLLTLLAVPVVADSLCGLLEPDAPLELDTLPDLHSSPDLETGAIVVLAGGYRRAPEYGGYQPNLRSLQRLRYGARLHRRIGLPLALMGGRPAADKPAEAELMRRVLERDFGLKARWVEQDSRNTAENARNAASMLRSDGVEWIYLVTHAFHMARAERSFRGLGLRVVPAPMGFCAAPGGRFELMSLWPQVSALQRSYFALHELLGMAWYAVRYGSEG